MECVFGDMFNTCQLIICPQVNGVNSIFFPKWCTHHNDV